MSSQKRLVEYHFSLAQMQRFLAANGLRKRNNFVVTPDGRSVGYTVRFQAGTKLTLIFEPYYVRNGCEVKLWWPDFRPAWRIIGGGEDAIGPTLGPEEAICDLCNARIQMRPVPVVEGHALCRECWEDMGLPLPGNFNLYDPEVVNG